MTASSSRSRAAISTSTTTTPSSVPDPGITGLKTGYTDAAGRCYVTTARQGDRHLGVVLLHSPNPLDQVPAPRAGFNAER